MADQQSLLVNLELPLLLFKFSISIILFPHNSWNITHLPTIQLQSLPKYYMVETQIKYN